MLGSTVGVMAVAFVLDRAGVFIYFGYVPVFVMFAAAVVGMLISMRRAPVSRAEAVALLVATLLLLASGAALPRTKTGPRKAFYIAASKVTPGMQNRVVESAMRSFDNSPFSIEPSVVTYRYASSERTVDTFTVRFDGEGRVSSTRYSAD
jgi:hypothetical protein